MTKAAFALQSMDLITYSRGKIEIVDVERTRELACECYEVVVALDLLDLNGRDLRKLPLIQRKAELSKIVDDANVQVSESFEIEGREMFAQACKLGLEGVVSKVRDGPYPKGRTSDLG